MLFNTVLLALKGLGRNAMRSILTMLGIVIGVSAVITMVTLGRGTTQSVAAQISSLGSNLLMVSPGLRQLIQSGARAEEIQRQHLGAFQNLRRDIRKFQAGDISGERCGFVGHRVSSLVSQGRWADFALQAASAPRASAMLIVIYHGHGLPIPERGA